MPRRRKSDHHLPPRVYRTTSGRYAYYPPEGGSKTIAGRKATTREIWEAYELAKQSLHPSRLLFLWLEYKGSDSFKKLSKVTQQDYEQCSQKPLTVFNTTNCQKLKPQHIRKYMDARGKQSKTRANRELAWLSNVFAHAYERGMMPSNPTKGVKQFKESTRKIYVTDEMYLEMYKVAPTVIRVAMELAYCTGLRPTDVLDLKWTQINPDGIYLTTSKTDQDLIKEITPRIREALDLAKTLPVHSFYVVPSSKGTRFTPSGFQTAWQRARDRVTEGVERFQFRDLRSKAITDFKGEKKRFSAHKTDAMVARYNRLPDKSPSH